MPQDIPLTAVVTMTYSKEFDGVFAYGRSEPTDKTIILSLQISDEAPQELPWEELAKDGLA
jgi:hypothetical protein